MKWTYAIPQKLQTATLLFGVMMLVVLFNVIERNNIARMNRSATSIYNDRLVPATDIFHLTEHLYSKRFVMETFLATDKNDVSRVRAELASHDTSIAELIHKVEQTYLVENESVFLNSFKNKAHLYGQMEQQILTLSENNRKADGKALYEAKGKASLDTTVRQLSELITVQTTVGSQLLDDTKGIQTISDLLSSLQIALAMVIAIMILSLISASKITQPRGQNFHLN